MEKKIINFRIENKKVDRKYIYELQYKAFIQELKHESPDFYKNKIYYNKIDENNIYIISELIDNCNSKIIGIASLTPPKSYEYSFEKSIKLIELANKLKENFTYKNIMEGRNLYVENEYRKFNIGSILMLLTIIVGEYMGAKYVIGKNNKNSLPLSKKQNSKKSNILIQNGETEYVIVYQECNKIIYDSWYKNIFPMIKNNFDINYEFSTELLDIFKKKNLSLAKL